MHKIYSRHEGKAKEVTSEEYYSLDKRIWKDYIEPFKGPLCRLVVSGKEKEINEMKDLKGIYIGK